MGLKAAVQALKKAEPLKNKVQHCKDLLNDNDAWVCQQQLQKIYQRVLILDLEYALDRKVEQELWNLGFKNYIATLQSQAKDRKNPKRGESQAMLGWCLEAASGFYLTLLQEICTAFDLDLPFRRKNYVYGCWTPWKAVEKLSTPHKSSCFYVCQYCLVHLGDIARYRNQNKQAELFYRHAVSLSPSSGQPYNQLALLEASRGDKLGTVFHYARSVAVKHPFPVATANLAKTLSSALNDDSFNIEGRTKLSAQEYINVFLKLHGILDSLGDPTIASSHVKLLTETLTALVATESFSSWRLVQFFVVNLYALHRAAGKSPDSTELLRTEQLGPDETMARDCILDLIAGSLSALLLPVYTIKNAIVDYFALPTIKLCLDWMRLQPTVLEEPAFVSRLQIWPSLCVLLNGLQDCVIDFQHDRYARVPLPEDRDLQGFLPLEKSFETLRFAKTDLEGDFGGLNKLRAVRILSVGHYLARHRIAGTSVIGLTTDDNNPGKFTCMSDVSGPSNELMKQLEELSLNKEKQPVLTNSPAPSESASSKASSETDLPEHLMEKRVGILKPQGSLERNRDSNASGHDASNAELNSLACARKPRQNVAMQAIMRRAETEQKQVTFKNVSPMMIEESEASVNEAIVAVSPSTRTLGTKTIQNHLQILPYNGASSQQTCGIVEKRAAPIGGVSTTLQSQQASSFPPMNLESKLPPATPPRSQFASHQPQQNLAANCNYQNQTFNVQNPQFGKNFVTSHVANIPQQQQQYRVPEQYNGTMPMAQCTNIQQNVHQQRTTADYQRIAQHAQQQQQQVSIGASLSQVLGLNQQQNLQTAAPGVQANVSIQQQNVAPSGNPRTNQMNMQQQGMSGGVGPAYQKNLHQSSGLQNVANPPPTSPTGISGLQLNFHPNFGQNMYNQMGQKQISPPSSYGKTANQFAFPNQQHVVNKTQHHLNNYPMFHNYDSSDFNLWKDMQQPPQPPAAWWGARGNPAVASMRSKETTASEAFQNWANSPGAAGSGAMGGAPLTPGNNYHQNPLIGKHYSQNNSFDGTRQFPVEQKQAQSANTGNTYSLFSGNTWGSGGQTSNLLNQDQPKSRSSHQQSLWSGPGPSPLERLLEQQKSLREGGT